MKILVLYSDVPGLAEDPSTDAESGKDAFITAEAVEQALRSRGHIVERVAIRKSMLDVLEPFDPREWLVFNLCQTLEGASYREAYVPAVLEALGFSYTGSNTRTLYETLNKPLTKARLIAGGLPTVKYQVFSSPDEAIRITFPAFVKPVAEDASIGVNDRSVVHTQAQLREQVEYVLKEIDESALVEEFIQGREFNVAIWGNSSPNILPLSEIDFSHIPDPHKKIISYAAKWDKESFEYQHTDPICPAIVDEVLANQIRSVAIRAFQVMGCRDYARVDMRVRDDQPYILEVNPNCSLAPDAGFTREASVGGYDYAAMVEQIAVFAMERMKHQ